MSDDPGHVVGKYKCIKTTELAILVRQLWDNDSLSEQTCGMHPNFEDDFPETWWPKSVIHDDSEVYDLGHEGRLVVKHWAAVKRGWAHEEDEDDDY